MRLQEAEGENGGEESDSYMEWGDGTSNGYFEDLESQMFMYNLISSCFSGGLIVLHFVFALTVGDYAYSDMVHTAVEKYSPSAITWVFTLFSDNPIVVFANMAAMSYTAESGPAFWDSVGKTFATNYHITNSELGTGLFDGMYYLHQILKLVIAAGLNVGQAYFLPQIQALTYRLAEQYDTIVELGFSDLEEAIGMGEDEEDEGAGDGEAEDDEAF